MILKYKLQSNNVEFEVSIKAESIDKGDELMEEVISGKIHTYDLVNTAMDNEGYFPIATVHRDDLEDRGFDISNVSDDDMARIGEKLGDAYMNVFWTDLDIIAEEYMNIPKLKK